MAARAKRTAGLRGLRALIVATLVILTAQGWFGDTANLFVVPANGVPPPAPSLSGFFSAVGSLKPPFVLVWHTWEGIVLVALAVAVFVLSFPWSRSKGVRIWSAVGLFFMLSAALGGYLFVMSGFAAGGTSAQMGGSFIGAYACYFMTLYYTK